MILAAIRNQVIACRRCPRLVRHRERMALVKIRRFQSEDYWGKPVPGFGGGRVRLLVVGLAPAAHGGNRTGRMFTGDRSGDWLYEAMYRYGFATSPRSISRGDGLRLRGAYITAVVRCAPPDNKPTREETETCRRYLVRELKALEDVRVVVALGKIAFDGFLAAWRELGREPGQPRFRFSHGAEHVLEPGVSLLASYHPSQQNTFTGRLTRPMFRQVFRRARSLLKRGVARPARRR
ncbi:MAG TPA: uracil-DNA glycosylase [Vicinamibacteria bacterium]